MTAYVDGCSGTAPLPSSQFHGTGGKSPLHWQVPSEHGHTTVGSRYESGTYVTQAHLHEAKARRQPSSGILNDRLVSP